MAIVTAGTQSYINFDEPPIYDEIIKGGDKPYVSFIWMAWFTSSFQTLISYITQNGIFLPQLTTAERDALVNPIGGQMIYNLDTDTMQIFIYTSHSPFMGNWKTVTVS